MGQKNRNGELFRVEFAVVNGPTSAVVVDASGG